MKRQEVYDIGGVCIGGQPGQNRTVMIGSMFYKGDKIIGNRRDGGFDQERARAQIENAEKMSLRTGLPAMIDVVCTDRNDTEKYLSFVSEVTSMPIVIDAVCEEVAVEGMKCAHDLGIIDRTILNSINASTKDHVFQKMADVGLKSAIVLAYSAEALCCSKGRVAVLESLLPKVIAAGITKLLVDTVVVDIATLGAACKAICDAKEKFGFPAGCGAHNAVDSWSIVKRRKDNMFTLGCSSAAITLPVAAGGDFVLYGPIELAKYIFPAISLVNAAYGQVALESGKLLEADHPIYRIGKFD